MFKFLKSKESKEKEPGLFSGLSRGLKRTRSHLTEGLGSLLLGKKVIDEDILEKVETHLLSSDVGIEATQEIIEDLTNKLKRKECQDTDA